MTSATNIIKYRISPVDPTQIENQDTLKNIKDPVVTTCCNNYFEKSALCERVQNNPTCPNCAKRLYRKDLCVKQLNEKKGVSTLTYSSRLALNVAVGTTVEIGCREIMKDKKVARFMGSIVGLFAERLINKALKKRTIVLKELCCLGIKQFGRLFTRQGMKMLTSKLICSYVGNSPAAILGEVFGEMTYRFALPRIKAIFAKK